LVIHGEQDEVIPFEMGRQVSDSLPNARLVAVTGGHHNDLFVVHGQRLLSMIHEFGSG
jgi:pimeloyl-ACP methyl ester carboxylesterase